MNSLQLNQSVAIKKKNGIYAIYYNFSYIFFKDVSAQLMDALLECISKKKEVNYRDIPRDFIEYLIDKKIIVEEK